MIYIALDNDLIVVDASKSEIAPRHMNQLQHWSFKYNSSTKQFNTSIEMDIGLVVKVTDYLTKSGLPYQIDESIQSKLDKRQYEHEKLLSSLEIGRELKTGNFDISESQDFQHFIDKNIPRELKEHQFKAALHLLSVKNGANFSVPGSGKTTVVLSVFQRLRSLNEIDALFVVGPPACFVPWNYEYKEVIGTKPSYEILAGGDIQSRRDKYITSVDSACDIYLTTFQTLTRDYNHVCELFSRHGIRFFFVIDEAHYIKQINGSWASAAMEVSRFATRRCILTGTPFPKSYTDAFNLFDFLWPETSPISEQEKYWIANFTQQEELQQATAILNKSIGPLIYRVRKNDLNLARQEFNKPISIRMNVYEKQVYDLITDQIQDLSQSDYMHNIDLLMNLRRGRMIRLRQCLSYTALLGTAIDSYSETFFEEGSSIADIIKNYDDLETPAKLEELVVCIKDLQKNGEKVVIWSNFVRTIDLIHKTALNLGYGVRKIYGATPVEDANVDEELTREGIIRDFIKSESGVDILVANPAACAESISLHKSCSHAIYYDLSYNCAQYLQSIDRIHRVGGSENKKSYYHFLQYEDTIDSDILANLQAKEERMSQVIDQDYPIYSLDMLSTGEDGDAYERLFK